MRKKRKPSVSSQILGRKEILMYPIVDPTYDVSYSGPYTVPMMYPTVDFTSGCVPFFNAFLKTFSIVSMRVLAPEVE